MKLVDGALLNRPDIVGGPRLITHCASFLAEGAQLWYFEWLGDVQPVNIASTYAAFKLALIAAFTNPADLMAARLELSRLQFGDYKSVGEFYAVFHKVSLRLPEPDGPERAYRFTEMLPPDVRAFVLERNPQTAVNAKAAALI